jgi:spore coat-associated protein N
MLVIGIAGSTVSYGTFATFTATVSSTGNTFSTGTLTLSTTPASLAALLSVGTLKPGDTISRPLTITNSGSISAVLTLTTATTSTPTLLSTDTTNGLQFKVDRCSQAWTGSSPTFTCGGTTTADVVSSRSIVQGTPISIGNLPVSGSDFLLITVSLPSTAGNTFQSLSETFSFNFTATQVAGEAR